ncbi:MAG: exosortase/archaeosortase family protein [Pirellulales bacterium]|nr:exosortase/archaeosortase family protein [Pirellulales bacterium]
MSDQQHPFSAGVTSEMEYAASAAPLDSAANSKMWAVFAVLVMCMTAGYWNMIEYTSSHWQKGLYSHGWILPLITILLLFMRSGVDIRATTNELLASAAVLLVALGIFSVAVIQESTPSSVVLVGVLVLLGLCFYHLRTAQLREVAVGVRWAGVGILVVCLLIRLVAAEFDWNPLDRLSFVGALLSACLIVGGTAMLTWAGPPLGFSIFMFPLPAMLETTVLMKLQGVAAVASTWTLQLLGCSAMRDGNKILIDQIPLDIADACSGLRMATIFGAMSVALAILMVERPWWDRLIILLSAIPVALVTNVIRITVTALLFKFFPESEELKEWVHDWAGLGMMPVAMGILWAELELLRRISIPIDVDDYAAFDAAAG